MQRKEKYQAIQSENEQLPLEYYDEKKNKSSSAQLRCHLADLTAIRELTSSREGLIFSMIVEMISNIK